MSMKGLHIKASLLWERSNNLVGTWKSRLFAPSTMSSYLTALSRHEYSRIDCFLWSVQRTGHSARESASQPSTPESDG